MTARIDKADTLAMRIAEDLLCQLAETLADGTPANMPTALKAGFIPEQMPSAAMVELSRRLVEQVETGTPLDELAALLEMRNADTITSAEAETLAEICRQTPSRLTVGSNVQAIASAAAKARADALQHRAELYLRDGNRAEARALLAEADAMDAGDGGSLDAFAAYRFDPESEPPPNVSTLYLDGTAVCNRGNISSLVAHKKAGKSRAARAILRAICSGGEHMGFTAPAGKVAYLDFEQSRADFHHLMQGVNQREEGRLLAYSMAGATIAEGRALVDLLAGQDDLRAIVLDGWADLVADPNVAEESNELVRWAMKLAAQHDISILGLLHLNPGSETKSRGHLGSQLERKCETQIEIMAAGEDRIICAPIARHRPVSKDQGVRIAWDDGEGDFVRIEGNPGEVKQAAKVEEWTRTLQDIEAETGMKAWKYGDLWEAIAKAEGVKERTAKTRIGEFLKAGLLTHGATTGNYTSALKD